MVQLVDIGKAPSLSLSDVEEAEYRAEEGETSKEPACSHTPTSTLGSHLEHVGHGELEAPTKDIVGSETEGLGLGSESDRGDLTGESVSCRCGGHDSGGDAEVEQHRTGNQPTFRLEVVRGANGDHEESVTKTAVDESVPSTELLQEERGENAENGG